MARTECTVAHVHHVIPTKAVSKSRVELEFARESDAQALIYLDRRYIQATAESQGYNKPKHDTETIFQICQKTTETVAS
jgi:hypothetical protein